MRWMEWIFRPSLLPPLRLRPSFHQKVNSHFSKPNVLRKQDELDFFVYNFRLSTFFERRCWCQTNARAEWVPFVKANGSKNFGEIDINVYIFTLKAITFLWYIYWSNINNNIHWQNMIIQLLYFKSKRIIDFMLGAKWMKYGHHYRSVDGSFSWLTFVGTNRSHEGFYLIICLF